MSSQKANVIADICSPSASPTLAPTTTTPEPTTTTPEPTTTVAAAGASQCPVDFCKVYFDGCNTCTCNTKGVLTRCSQQNTCAGSAKAAKCRKFHPKASIYTKIAAGRCDADGGSTIKTQADCGAAAFDLGLFDAMWYCDSESAADRTACANIGTDSNRPEGCYYKEEKLWWNSNPNNAGNGATAEREQLCRKAE